MSEGGEKPKSLNRIDNIRQSRFFSPLRYRWLCLILAILFRLFGFSPSSDIGGFA
jgi:hypothetical protein